MSEDKKSEKVLIWQPPEQEIIHPYHYFSKYLKVMTLDGEIVPLDVNIAQQRVLNTIYEYQEKNDLPVRAIILKARREGVSTAIAARFFLEINEYPNRFANVVSADQEATSKVFRMSQLFQNQMPEDKKLETVYSSKKEIVYSEPHNSQLVMQTAGKQVLGRGGLTHLLHLSEVAFYSGDPKAALAGIFQEVPEKPRTWIVLESTANGQGGLYYDMWTSAVNDWKRTKNPKGWLPIFLPWFIFPDYQFKIPDDTKIVIGSPHDAAINAVWCEDEEELTEKYKLCPEQLYWRRMTIRNKCQGDLDLFNSEYPSSASVAFVSTGRNVFNQTHLARMTSNTEYITGKSSIFTIDTSNKILPEGALRSSQCWKIFKYVDLTHEYTIGIDTMEGTQANPDDPKSPFDWHAVQVLDRDTGEFVAEYRGRGNQRDLGEQCLLCAKYYNNAWIAPELPMGMVVLDVLRESGYDRIYQRQKGDEQRVESDGENLGWRTTSITRYKMIDDFRVAIHDSALKIYSNDFMEELKTFVYDCNGNARHISGKHDDAVFAGMIALELHMRCPFRPKAYAYDSVFTSPKKGKTEGVLPEPEDENSPTDIHLSRRNVKDGWNGEEVNSREDFVY